jgi:hypothetical protein
MVASNCADKVLENIELSPVVITGPEELESSGRG